MVYILNGECLDDTDPRAIRARGGGGGGRSTGSSGGGNRSNIGRIHSGGSSGGGSSGGGGSTNSGGSSGGSSGGANRGGGNVAVRAPGELPSWLQPGSTLGDVNAQLSNFVQPFNLGTGLVVQPIALLGAGVGYYVGGVQGFALAVIVYFFAMQQGMQVPGQPLQDQSGQQPRPFNR